jgi:hypothetical protein
MSQFHFRTFDYIKDGFRLFTQKPKKLLLFFLGIWIAAIVLTPLEAIPLIGQALHLLLVIFAQAGAYLLVEGMATTPGEGNWQDLKKLNPLSGQLILAQITFVIFVVLGVICLVVPGIYLIVAYLFFLPLITLRGETFWDALEMSRKRVQKNWFAVAGFLLILLFINLLGAITVIGILITAPASACALYFAFQDLFPADKDVVITPELV